MRDRLKNGKQEWKVRIKPSALKTHFQTYAPAYISLGIFILFLISIISAEKSFSKKDSLDVVAASYISKHAILMDGSKNSLIGSIEAGPYIYTYKRTSENSTQVTKLLNSEAIATGDIAAIEYKNAVDAIVFAKNNILQITTLLGGASILEAKTGVGSSITRVIVKNASSQKIKIIIFSIAAVAGGTYIGYRIADPKRLLETDAGIKAMSNPENWINFQLAAMKCSQRATQLNVDILAIEEANANKLMAETIDEDNNNIHQSKNSKTDDINLKQLLALRSSLYDLCGPYIRKNKPS
jgi:hypothetical protein